MKKHQNIKLKKNNSWALYGANCSFIEKTVHSLIEQLKNNYSVLYVDQDHNSSNNQSINRLLKVNDAQQYTSSTDFTDPFKNEHDLILVNGNHFTAENQLVFIHPEKEASLKRRLDQLTNIKAYILGEGLTAPYDFLPKGPPPIKLEDLAIFLEKENPSPEINALVLTGGKSLRMGENKSEIMYNGMSQRDYLALELNSLKLKLSISVGNNQPQSSLEQADEFLGLGPLSGILTAFKNNPNNALLVVACDLPLINRKTFELLIKHRNPSKMATAFYNPETGFADPLLTIYEPKAYGQLLKFLALGYNCPRKMLINSPVELIKVEDATFLKNANTPEDKEEILTVLGRNGTY